MKKKLLLISLIALLICGSTWARSKGWVRASSSQSASAAVVTTGPGLLHYVFFFTDGSTANTVNIYDNASAASGTKLIPTDFPLTSSATDRGQSISFNPPARFFNGVYVNVSSTCEYMVYYEFD